MEKDTTIINKSQGISSPTQMKIAVVLTIIMIGCFGFSFLQTGVDMALTDFLILIPVGAYVAGGLFYRSTSQALQRFGLLSIIFGSLYFAYLFSLKYSDDGFSLKEILLTIGFGGYAAMRMISRARQRSLAKTGRVNQNDPIATKALGLKILVIIFLGSIALIALLDYLMNLL